jgi:excisionase family DNA binding protein
MTIKDNSSLQKRSEKIFENNIASGLISDPLLNVKELSLYLGVSESFAYERIARKDIASYKVGRLVRVRKSEIDKWLNSERR